MTMLLKLLDMTSKWLTLAAIGSFFYFGDLHAFYTVAGGLLTVFTAKILKLAIRQPRPVQFDPNAEAKLSGKTTKPSYGMPSSHSSTIIFFAAYISLHVLVACFPNGPLDFAPHDTVATAVTTRDTAILTIVATLAIVSLAVVWSRVSLGHHTRAQVLAGVALGCVCASAWNHAWWSLWSPAFEKRGLLGRLERAKIEVLYHEVTASAERFATASVVGTAGLAALAFCVR